MIRATAFALATLLSYSGVASPKSSGVPPEKKRAPSWHVVVTPAAGFFKNILRFSYEMPTGPDERTPVTKELTDTGWGAAVMVGLMGKRFAITNVTFLVPDVNECRVLGNVLYASYRHPVTEHIDIFGGLGMVYNNIVGVYENFEDSVTKNGVTATAHFDEFHITNNVFAPFPRVGVRFKLPIQHWYIAPWASYMLEAFRLDIYSPGGRVNIPEPINDTKIIPEIRSEKWKFYHSPLVGLDLFLDFHYALQLRVRAHYDLNHDKLNIRVMGAAFFSRRVPIGIAAYFTYAEGIVHDNIYAFVGPSYLF
ncbi:MAG: hypothetical protein JRH20_20380 [Deltaproteobacteria bacterium]|nr:hypothetical protein [Deltaproteobacteria bacterium]